MGIRDWRGHISLAYHFSYVNTIIMWSIIDCDHHTMSGKADTRNTSASGRSIRDLRYILEQWLCFVVSVPEGAPETFKTYSKRKNLFEYPQMWATEVNNTGEISSSKEHLGRNVPKDWLLISDYSVCFQGGLFWCCLAWLQQDWQLCFFLLHHNFFA